MQSRESKYRPLHLKIVSKMYMEKILITKLKGRRTTSKLKYDDDDDITEVYLQDWINAPKTPLTNKAVEQKAKTRRYLD